MKMAINYYVCINAYDGVFITLSDKKNYMTKNNLCNITLTNKTFKNRIKLATNGASKKDFYMRYSQRFSSKKQYQKTIAKYV